MVSCCLYVQSTHNTRQCTVNAIKKCYLGSSKKRIFTLFNFHIFDQRLFASLGIYDEGNRSDSKKVQYLNDDLDLAGLIKNYEFSVQLVRIE